MKTKRKKPFAANNASKKHLESLGWTVAVVEKTLGGTFIKKDCFGFGDLLAFNSKQFIPAPGGIMLVQATTGRNFSSRLKGVLANPAHEGWLKSGGRIQVHCWTQRAGHKQRQLRLHEVKLSQ